MPFRWRELPLSSSATSYTVAEPRTGWLIVPRPVRRGNRRSASAAEQALVHVNRNRVEAGLHCEPACPSGGGSRWWYGATTRRNRDACHVLTKHGLERRIPFVLRAAEPPCSGELTCAYTVPFRCITDTGPWRGQVILWQALRYACHSGRSGRSGYRLTASAVAP